MPFLYIIICLDDIVRVKDIALKNCGSRINKKIAELAEIQSIDA